MNKEILRLAVPNILSNISIPLLSTVDTILMGSLSPKHLGAVGVGAMIFNFIYWNFGFLRMGTTGMTAQAYGAKDQSEQIHNFIRASMIALLLAGMMIIFMKPIEWISLNAFNVEGSQADLVSDYFRIRIWAAPASLLIYVLTGWFFGMQNAIFPLVITIVVNVINMILSIYLVKYQGMGMRGVALGTVAAQYVGVFLGLLLLTWKYGFLRKFVTMAWKGREHFLRFLSVNRDIFIRTVFLTFAFSFFYSKSAEAGEIVLAVNVILLQFLNWMSYGIDGFAYAAESMVGKYIGANDEKKSFESIKVAFVWGFGLAVFFSLLYMLFYGEIVSIFSEDPNIVVEATKFKWWMVAFPLVAFACYIWDGIFIGLTASNAMRNTMVLAFIIYIGSYYLLKNIMPLNAIWIALMVFLFARSVFQSLVFNQKRLDLK